MVSSDASTRGGTKSSTVTSESDSDSEDESDDVSSIAIYMLAAAALVEGIAFASLTGTYVRKQKQ